ncbi:MAG: hypothetical protein E6R04_06235 [Spirochaetes bacterium]|nr:MAG: hypothetical protein E6R04_06235 [Spirochaetota bacterium]
MSRTSKLNADGIARIWEDALREARAESVARERRAVRHRHAEFSTVEAKRIWKDAISEAQAESVERERRAVRLRHVPDKVKTPHR